MIAAMQALVLTAIALGVAGEQQRFAIAPFVSGVASVNQCSHLHGAFGDQPEAPS